MAIDDTKLRQSIYKVIRDTIEAYTFNTSKTPTIIAAFSDKDAGLFPQIVINPINVSRGVSPIGSDRKTSSKTISINIDIYTKSNRDLDILTDDFDEILSTDFEGFTLTAIDEVVGEFYPNQQKLRVKTISCTYIRR